MQKSFLLFMALLSFCAIAGNPQQPLIHSFLRTPDQQQVFRYTRALAEPRLIRFKRQIQLSGNKPADQFGDSQLLVRLPEPLRQETSGHPPRNFSETSQTSGHPRNFSETQTSGHPQNFRTKLQDTKTSAKLQDTHKLILTRLLVILSLDYRCFSCVVGGAGNLAVFKKLMDVLNVRSKCSAGFFSQWRTAGKVLMKNAPVPETVLMPVPYLHQ